MFTCLSIEGVDKKGEEGGSTLKLCSDIKVLTHPPHPLTDASYVRLYRGRMDKEARITASHESFHEVVFLILSLLHKCTCCSPFPYPLHMFYMVTPPTSTGTCLCASVYSVYVYHVSLLSSLVSKKGRNLTSCNPWWSSIGLPYSQKIRRWI